MEKCSVKVSTFFFYPTSPFLLIPTFFNLPATVTLAALLAVAWLQVRVKGTKSWQQCWLDLTSFSIWVFVQLKLSGCLRSGQAGRWSQQAPVKQTGALRSVSIEDKIYKINLDIFHSGSDWMGEDPWSNVKHTIIYK